jgi:hypothetical protein
MQLPRAGLHHLRHDHDGLWRLHGHLERYNLQQRRLDACAELLLARNKRADARDLPLHLPADILL